MHSGCDLSSKCGISFTHYLPPYPKPLLVLCIFVVVVVVAHSFSVWVLWGHLSMVPRVTSSSVWSLSHAKHALSLLHAFSLCFVLVIISNQLNTSYKALQLEASAFPLSYLSFSLLRTQKPLTASRLCALLPPPRKLHVSSRLTYCSNHPSLMLSSKLEGVASSHRTLF